MHPAAQAADLPACATGGEACVIVETIDGTGTQRVATFSSDDVTGPEADVTDTTYDGTSVSRGSSVQGLLTRAGIDPGTVHFVEVDGPDAYGRHVLTADESSPTATGGARPVFFPDPSVPQRMNFARDSRGSDDELRQPGPDQGRLLTGDGGALVIAVHTDGEELKPHATATPTDAGSRTFTMTCSGCAGLSTTWYFPDGTTSQQAAPAYTFPSGYDAGDYLVAVSVEDSGDGSFGWSETDARIGAKPAPSPTASQTGSGGNNAGTHGATHGSSHSAGPGAGHGAGGSASAAASPSATATSQSSGGPTGPSTGPLPTALPSSSAILPPTVGTGRTPSATPTPMSPTTPRPTPTGPTVTGVLLDAAQAAPVTSSGAEVRDDAPRPSAAAAPALDPSFRIDPLVWLGLGGAVLLGAGAASENDRVRRAVTRRLRRWARIGG